MSNVNPPAVGVKLSSDPGYTIYVYDASITLSVQYWLPSIYEET